MCIKYFISLFFLLRLQLTANPLNKITNMKTKLVPNIPDGFRPIVLEETTYFLGFVI